MQAAQPAQLTDVLLFEEDREYSREVVTLLDGSDVDFGTVMGVVTVSGKWTNFDDTAANGTENAAGISLGKAAPSGADQDHVVLVRHARCKKSGLIWPGTADQGEQDAAIAQLKTLGILVEPDA